MVAVFTSSDDAAAVTMFITSAGASGANDAAPSVQTVCSGQVAVGSSGAIACRRGAPNAESAMNNATWSAAAMPPHCAIAARRVRGRRHGRRTPTSNLIHERRCIIGKNNRFSALELMFRDPLAPGGALEERAVGRVLIDGPHLPVARDDAHVPLRHARVIHHDLRQRRIAADVDAV